MFHDSHSDICQGPSFSLLPQRQTPLVPGTHSGMDVGSLHVEQGLCPGASLEAASPNPEHHREPRGQDHPQAGTTLSTEGQQVTSHLQLIPQEVDAAPVLAAACS